LVDNLDIETAKLAEQRVEILGLRFSGKMSLMSS